MKYLLVLAVVIIAIWLWRKDRQEALQDKLRERTPPPRHDHQVTSAAPTPMARCAHCGLHFPAADAVHGAAGQVYCGAAHRKAAEERG
jgi:uncharacterized protein